MSSLILNAAQLALPSDERNLLDFLRDGQALTAAKPACRGGDCGACQVLLGERPPEGGPTRYVAVNSCLLTTGRVAGGHLITVEGLSRCQPNPLPNPIQQVLAEEGAVQCGYCTPGLVVALTAALLAGQPLLQGAAGNLCRCTGYGAIRRACERLQVLYECRPRTLAEAAALGWVAPEVAAAAKGLAELAQASLPAAPPGVAVAGETDWSLRHAHEDPQALWQLHRLPELRRIDFHPEQIGIGAAVTVAELQQSPLIAAEWPELPGHLELFASPAIRNSATVGGNLVNASPIADLALILLALDAALSLQQGERTRRLPLADFYTGYRQTRLEPGEWLREIHVPRRGQRLYCEKLSRRQHDDIASVNLALAVNGGDARTLGEVRLAAGGVGPVPRLLADTSRALSGCALNAAAVRRALSGLDGEIAPIDDVRGTADYKRRALRHQIVAALDALHPTAGLDWQEALR